MKLVNESVEKVLDDPNQLKFGGLLPLRLPAIVQYNAFYAFDFSFLSQIFCQVAFSTASTTKLRGGATTPELKKKNG